MRFFLIIANMLLLLGLLFFFRQEMRHVSRVDWVPVGIFFSVVALTCMNIGYILATRTDQSVIARVRRFVRLWKQSA
jgi:hypothetical protein